MRTRSIQLSLKHLRKAGWQVAIVEKWLKAPGMKFGKRIDVWGFGDLLACLPACRKEQGFAEKGNTCLQTPGTCESCPKWWDKERSSKPVTALFQTTAMSERQRHLDKISNIPEVRIWQASGNLVILHSWRKLKPRGKRERWEVKEEIL